MAELRGRPGVEVVRVSSLYETAPVGGPAGQGRISTPRPNCVRIAPDALLRLLLDVESGLGRVRTERDGPRTIDSTCCFTTTWCATTMS